MTTNKAQKRAVRARMAKTGERYAAARRIILDLHREPEHDEAMTAPPADGTVASPDAVFSSPQPETAPTGASPESAPGMSDAAILRATGKGWEEWFALLDAWGATDQCHRAIAHYLEHEHGLGGWWAQSVTVGYERARGRRALYEKADGFALSVSRTFPVAAERLTAFFTDDVLRDRWLEPGTLTVRTAVPGRSARFDVAGGGRLAVFLTAKDPAKTAASLQHEKLPDAAAVATWRAFWKERLARLAEAIAE